MPVRVVAQTEQTGGGYNKGYTKLYVSADYKFSYRKGVVARTYS